MPPFAGNEAERRALSVYLASLEGGEAPATAPPATPSGPGAAAFETHCAACHAPDGDWPITVRLGGRDAAAWYDLLGRLDLVNANMPPFLGSEDERRALADYLAGLAATSSGGAP
jgi:mono/diheme cytochrome c family protein